MVPFTQQSFRSSVMWLIVVRSIAINVSSDICIPPMPSMTRCTLPRRHLSQLRLLQSFVRNHLFPRHWYNHICTSKNKNKQVGVNFASNMPAYLPAYLLTSVHALDSTIPFPPRLATKYFIAHLPNITLPTFHLWAYNRKINTKLANFCVNKNIENLTIFRQVRSFRMRSVS